MLSGPSIQAPPLKAAVYLHILLAIYCIVTITHTDESGDEDDGEDERGKADVKYQIIITLNRHHAHYVKIAG